MTEEEFIEVLDEEWYSYEMEGNKIVVTQEGPVNLNTLTSLPTGVVFRNGGNVRLDSLTSLPPGVVFKNEGGVNLSALTSISPGVEFKNEGHLGHVYLGSLLGGWFSDWKGNIEGIDEKRLLNKMISIGIFNRR